ncbi:MAG TPA: WbqC family protein [Saprospiraceae bacterium]|nr:WbqC family protein [Saprospiraceae bacterium]
MNTKHVVCIHQAAFVPWLGLIESMFATEHFVILDDVQYENGGYQNRNKIISKNGSDWITIPVSVKFKTQLNQVKIAPNYDPSSILKAIQSAYGRTIYFNEVMHDFTNILNNYLAGDLLCELNISLLKWIANKLNCKCKFVCSSELETNSRSKLVRIAEICSKLKATHLYTGTGMLDYCSPEEILNLGIIPIFHNYQQRHVKYKQRFHKNEFVPCLSILDLLFNMGYIYASEELKSSAQKVLEDAFKSQTTYFSS